MPRHETVKIYANYKRYILYTIQIQSLNSINLFKNNIIPDYSV